MKSLNFPGLPRVLIIDDEAPILRIYSRLLGTEHEVLTASSAPQALELLAQDANFDMIICDLMMPEMDGMAFFDELCERDLTLASRMWLSTGGAIGSEFALRCRQCKPSRVCQD